MAQTGTAEVLPDVISPVPPPVVAGSGKDGQVEVSASPAFFCLDELFSSGKLTGTRVAQLKAKYQQLHETLKLSRSNEAELLKQAKENMQKLQEFGADLDKADTFPENSSTEVSKARQLLLQHSNDLKATEERLYQMNYKIDNLNEEAQLLRREYNKMPHEEDLNKREKELKSSIDEMRKEMAQRVTEKKTLKEDLEQYKRLVEKEKKEMEEIKVEIDLRSGDLAAVSDIPNDLARDCAKLARQKQEEENKLAEVEKTCKDLIEDIKATEMEIQTEEHERHKIDASIQKARAEIEDREREYDELIKEQAYAKEREDILYGDRATLDINMNHLEKDRRNELELRTRKTRELDRVQRALKKVELQLRVAEENKAQTDIAYEKSKHAIGNLSSQLAEHPRDEEQTKMLIAMRKDTELKKKELLNQQALTAAEQYKVEETMKQEESLLFSESDLRIEVVELSRLAAIKHDEREQKARDLKKAEMRFTRTKEELKTRDLQIHDHDKKLSELKSKLEEFSKLYNIIKNERNKCVNLIQISTQKAAEMREKIKILQNEMEILRTSVSQKDKTLQKQRLKHIAAIVLKDSLRNEVSKQNNILSQLKDERDQQKMDINKLNMLINQNEEAMVTLRKQYETAVQQRNDRGVQLIERNEEVCIFYEKVNIQDTMLRKGQVELSGREEEKRFLEMTLKEEQRQIDNARKCVPEKWAQEQQVTTLQIQLAQCQDRLMDLEKAVENPTDEQRVRFVEGTDLTPAELHTKIEEVERRLADKEELLLEKDLILEQVTRLMERVRTKHSVGCDDTLNLAKRVNQMQADIKSVTRKMMAQVAELSMEQANALKLQQTLRQREAFLEQCYVRLERGEAPSDEWEREWNRMLAQEQYRRMEANELAQVEEELSKYTLADGSATSAEPRPNAYIPDDESELPIPRPYGTNAPFKPKEAGANMRHIRKPQPKPIEI